MQLSEHFTLTELTASATADKHGIDNTPNSAARLRLAYLCQAILEPIRQRYGFPIYISSGYRCPELNNLVGGAKNSQHLTGDAADIVCRATNNAYLFQIIAKMIREEAIEVGQLIWEFGTADSPAWIHISNPRPGKKNNEIIYLHD